MQTIGNLQESSSGNKILQNNSETKRITGFQNANQRENINRNGRPPGSVNWKTELEQAIDEIAKDGKKFKYHMARAMVREVLKGNVRAFDSITNRMNGKPLQPIDHTTQGDKIVTPMHYIPDEKDE